MFKSAPLKQLVAFLSSETGYQVSTTRPIDATRRSSGVVIQRVGTWETGETSLHEIDRPVYDLWCYAPDVGQAYDMAEAVTVVMERFKSEPHITYCKQYSAYDDSTPEDGPAFKLGYRIVYVG